jgi:ABC-type nitrate/sulfonate/bicarbonate transport system substrate-binding protein
LAEKNITTPADLENRVLGITGNEPFRNVIYNALLNEHQVPVNTVTYKNIAFDPIDALISDIVDAVVVYRTNGPNQPGAKNVQLNYIKPEDYGFELYNDVLVTTQQFLDKHPEEARAFVQASLQGWKEALVNQEAAVTATLTYTEGELNNAELQRYILSNSAPLIQPEGLRNLGTMTGSRWQHIYEIYKSNVVSPAFDVTKAYDLSFLP